MKKTIVVFTGFNQRAVIAFLRTLEKNQVNYCLVTAGSEDEIYKTSYKEKVIFKRKDKELNSEVLRDILKTVVSNLGNSTTILAPSTEYLNRLVLEDREHIEGMGVIVPLCNKRLYELISDKESFVEACKNHDINVPRELDSPQRANLPIVAKPKRYFSETGRIFSPEIIETEKDLEIFINSRNTDDYFYQEKIGGRSIYLLYYFSKDNIVSFSQENLAQQPEGRSVVAAVSSTFHQKKVLVQFAEMFKALGFNGLVMVEVKYDSNQFYMIEANPRFWGPSQLFVDAGVNLFEFLLYDLGAIHLKPAISDSNENIRYFWSGGIKDLASLTYHNYSEEALKKEFGVWCEHDIYNRDDTIELYDKRVSVK